jgi:hypothetical protein
MKVFDVGEHAVGFIAIGGVATGVFAFGQVATGVVAIGQIARGVFAVGQFAGGVATVGQLSIGLGYSVGMLSLTAGRIVAMGGVGARGKGLAIAEVWPKPPASEVPAVVPLAKIEKGSLESGFVRLRLDRDATSGEPRVFDGSRALDVELSGDASAQANGLLQVHASRVFAELAWDDRSDTSDEGGYRTAPAQSRVLVCKKLLAAPDGGMTGLNITRAVVHAALFSVGAWLLWLLVLRDLFDALSNA